MIPLSTTDQSLIRQNPNWWKLWYFLAEERFKGATNQEYGGSRNLIGSIIAAWYSQSLPGAWDRCRREVSMFFIRPAIRQITCKDIEEWLKVCNTQYIWLLAYPNGLVSLGLDSSYIQPVELDPNVSNLEVVSDFESQKQSQEDDSISLFKEWKKAESLDDESLLKIIGKTIESLLIKKE